MVNHLFLLKMILHFPEGGKGFYGVARSMLEIPFGSLIQCIFMAAQKGVGGLFQGEGRWQGGKTLVPFGLFEYFPIKQGGIVRIDRFGEAYIT